MTRNRTFTKMLCCAALAMLTATPTLAAPRDSETRAEKNRGSKAGPSNATLALSHFVGAPSGEAVQLITGYDGAAIYTDTGGAAEVTGDAIVLRRKGTYRIHLEGVIGFASADESGHNKAAGLFTLVLNGEPWVSCSTPERASAPRLASGWGLSPDHDIVASCKVDFTVRVQGSGSEGGFPLVFPRNTAVQAALIANDRALGDATVLLTRLEVSRTR